MNIVVIAHFQYDNSPYCLFVRQQVIAYKKMGHNVVVISPLTRFKKGVNKYAENKMTNIVDNVKVYYPRHLSFSNYGKYGANSYFAFKKIDKIFRKIVTDFKPDIIHANMIGFDGKIGTMLKEKYNIPLFITTHGSDTTLEIENGKGKYISEICKKADGVVAVSSKLKNQLLQQDNNLNIQVIHNGFDCDYAKPLEKTPHSIISVGNLKKQKNFDITIKAFNLVLKKYPDATLTIIGDGSEKENLINLVKDLNIINSVNFAGRLDNKNVLRQMASSDVFVLPSTKEGFGIVYLEAMASGCFTIGTKGEGIADIIKSEENGILINPGDYNEIAEYIAKAFDNNEYKIKIQNEGILCARKLTWEENARKNTEFFEKEIGYVSQTRDLQKA